jgi:hypothetical protein
MPATSTAGWLQMQQQRMSAAESGCNLDAGHDHCHANRVRCYPDSCQASDGWRTVEAGLPDAAPDGGRHRILAAVGAVHAVVPGPVLKQALQAGLQHKLERCCAEWNCFCVRHPFTPTFARPRRGGGQLTVSSAVALGFAAQVVASLRNRVGV